MTKTYCCYGIYADVGHSKDCGKAMGGWRPIEFAPKDGTRILVTRHPSVTRPPINIAWFSVKLLKRRERPWKMTGKKLPYDPTHWQPLPPTIGEQA